MRGNVLILCAVAAFVAATSGIGTAGHSPEHATCQIIGEDVDEVVIPIGGIAAGFIPPCVSVASGTTILWRNDDRIAHDPGSTIDGGLCFRSRFHFGTTADMPPGSTYRVTFFNAAGDSSAVFAENEPEDCDPAEHSESTASKVVIPYLCYRHPTTMVATIEVRA